jgi:hypothetical protein
MMPYGQLPDSIVFGNLLEFENHLSHEFKHDGIQNIAIKGNVLITHRNGYRYGSKHLNYARFGFPHNSHPQPFPVFLALGKSPGNCKASVMGKAPG